jgi:hypothetical protein
VVPEPALGDAPNVLPSDPAALDQACRRVLVTDDDRRVRRVEGLLEPRSVIIAAIIEPDRAAHDAGTLPPDAEVRVNEDHIGGGIR